MSTICIYHDHCQDGFAAAWAVRHALGADVLFHAAHYGSAPPSVNVIDDVVIVDFSYPLQVLESLRGRCRSVLVLDHHKTAEAALDSMSAAPVTWDGDHRRLELLGFCPDQNGFAALFNMTRSGAGLAWDWFHPGQERPYVLKRIEDRDLGGGIGDNPARFLDTTAVCAAVASYPFDFGEWNHLMDSDQDKVHDLVTEGVSIVRSDRKRAQELISNAGIAFLTFGEVRVPVVNAPFFMASEVGNLLAQGDPSKAGATYFDTVRGRVFSLRSLRDGPDVSAWAKTHGGGGHARAAGFTLPPGTQLYMER